MICSESLGRERCHAILAITNRWMITMVDVEVHLFSIEASPGYLRTCSEGNRNQYPDLSMLLHVYWRADLQNAVPLQNGDDRL
jgi:hypothetical protein